MNYDTRCAALVTLNHALEYLETIHDSAGMQTPADCVVIEDAIYALRDEHYNDAENRGTDLPTHPICYSLTRSLKVLHTLEYQVIEDNGGGLHLYVFGAGGIDGGKVTYAGTNFESSVGSLRSCLDALDAGQTTFGWEDGQGGDLGDPQAHYDQWDKWEYGWAIVAEGREGTRILFPQRMGVAAGLEFNYAAE